MPEIRLHFIGQRFYSIKRFVKEAERHGVSRALPASIIKSLKWGDLIFLAQYKPRHDSNDGIAHIFGFMRVTGISVMASDKVKAMAREKLRITTMVDGPPRAISRACGSYIVSGTFIVEDELADVVKAYEEAAHRCGEKVSFLLDGSLTLLKHPIEVEGVKFSRGILRLPIADEELSEDDRISIEEALCLQAETGKVHLIKDYRKQGYVRKSAPSCLSLDYFI